MASLSYNIFKRDAGGAPIWVEAVQDLETAKSRIIELSAEAPGQYGVFSQKSGRVVGSGTIVASPAARSAHKVKVMKNSRGETELPQAEPDTLWE
jgi:hypothetical protein